MAGLKQKLQMRREKAVCAARRVLTGLFRRSILEKNVFAHREAIAWLYIGEGRSGVEIGAAQNPLRLPRSVDVKYVDRISKDELLRQICDSGTRITRPLVEVDIIDEADKLENIPDSSQDFVIANHVLEHCQDPIGAVGNMLRVLTEEGILFLSIPDKRFTFDSDRRPTRLEHLARDHAEGPGWSKRQHFMEWARHVEKVEGGAEVEKRADELMDKCYGIHYHVWTQAEMMELFVYLKNESGLNFEIEHFSKNGIEAIFVLRKTF